MGGFLGIGGSQSKTDRTVQLESFGGLKNLFNWALPQGKTATAGGLSDLSSAGGFWQKLMSGNRSAVNAAVAPQANTAQTQADAQRRQQVASGTARGGGTAGPAQTQKDSQLAQIQNMLFGARTTGASELGKVGGAEANVGGNLLNTSETALTNEGALATEAKKTADAQQAAMGQAAGQLAMSLLFG